MKKLQKDLNAFDVAICVPCPPQKKVGYGLFTTVVVAHVVAGDEINPSLFHQNQITIFRKESVKEFDDSVSVTWTDLAGQI